MSQKRKLFIIGNGFDLAHGLKTKYKDFRISLELFVMGSLNIFNHHTNVEM
ncbi:MAG: bacteriophage abortive infection AbiH family protein [Lachnospiraceae bacterium]|nr:bacteriophage abortive infection AbiH family protein [Lachnospiraceae bacterium]